MARKTNVQPQIVDKVLTLQEIELGLMKFEKRKLEVLQLQTDDVTYNDQRVKNVEHSLQDTIRIVFGENSSQYNRNQYFRFFFATRVNMSERELQGAFKEGLSKAIVLIDGLEDVLEEKRTEVQSRDTLSQVQSINFKPALEKMSKEVFIVHGLNALAKEELARVLQSIDLSPIILHEQPDQGQTLIEKFEKNTSNVSFAVVLLTPDDFGFKVNEDMDSKKTRARQNVVLELGYFIGQLGRDRVCILNAGVEELPSDILGFAYTPMDPAGAWKAKLGKELKAAGYTFEFEKLF